MASRQDVCDPPQEQAELLDFMAESLQSMGMMVIQVHAESAPGQFEVVLGHLSDLSGEHSMCRGEVAGTSRGCSFRC